MEGCRVIQRISLALVLMAMAGVASAADHTDQCWHYLRFTYCPNDRDRDGDDRPSVKAPEIDPASAMAGLTMLAGGLAVLRGRRRINSKD